MYKDDKDNKISSNYLISTFLPFFNILLVFIFIFQTIYIILSIIWNVYIKRRMTFKQLMESEFK